MKKFLSVILSIAMIASMAVVSMAANALPAVTGNVMSLTEDVTVNYSSSTDCFEVNGTSLTVKLNGHTINSGDRLFYVREGGSLTIEGPGTINAVLPIYSDKTYSNVNPKTNSTNNDANTIVLKNVTINSNYFGVYHNGNRYGANVTIDGCTITDDGGAGVYLSGCDDWDDNKSTLKIIDSVISGGSAVEVRYCDVTVENSTLEATGAEELLGNNNGTCSSGYALALTNNGVSNSDTEDSKGEVVIKSGNLIGEVGIAKKNGDNAVIDNGNGASIKAITGVFTDSDNIDKYVSGIVEDSNGNKVVAGDSAESGFGIDLKGPYTYDADTRSMVEKDYEYGEPVYFALIDELTGSQLSERDFVEKLKVKAAFIMGEEYVESFSVVKKNVNGEYLYFLEFVTADKAVTSEADVFVNVRFDRKADKDDARIIKIKECKRNVDFTLFYPNTWLTDGTIKEDRADLEWDTAYALKFDNDEEVELSFGSPSGGNNEGTFTVDVSGQGTIFLEYTTEADEAIYAANEGAKLDFLTFKGAKGVGVKFNRTGEFRYEMEDAAYAYRVVDGKLAPIAGLEVEDDEFVFNTNCLEAYVFSDTELVQPA